MNSTLKRSTLALATVVACLAIMASPASANPSHTAIITGGTVNIASPAASIPLAGGGGGCPAASITIGHDTATSPHGVDVTQLSSLGEFELPAGSNQWWVAKIDRLASTAGTHGAGTISNVKVQVRAEVRGPIVQGSCNTAAAVRCTLTTPLVSAATPLTFNGTWTDNAPVNGDLESGDTALVSSGTVVVTRAPGCLTPFASISTASVSNLGLTLTS